MSNLMYLAGAVVVAVVISSALVLRHRKPRSVEANMASFHRGLRALAPDHPPGGRRPDEVALRRRPSLSAQGPPAGHAEGPEDPPGPVT
ncbi:MAG: hypothetical protein ACR2NJ_13215 [Acidimicrobiales bacterium]